MPARFLSDLGFVLLFWAVLGGGSTTLLYFSPKADPGQAEGGNRPEVLEEVDFARMQRVTGAETTLIDTRARDQYQTGHIPGAVSWPRSEMKKIPASVSELPGNRQVIVYCSGVECEDAAIVARNLRALGFRRIGIYRGGWEEWTENGGTVER